LEIVPVETVEKPMPALSYLQQIQAGQAFIVNSHRRNGVLLMKPYHTEFAGPGAIIGGPLDLDCQKLLPVGRLSLLVPSSTADYHRACLIRRQWIILIHQITSNPDPQERIRLLMNQFENYFDLDKLASVPDDAFARLVGVFPQTIVQFRQ